MVLVKSQGFLLALNCGVYHCDQLQLPLIAKNAA